MEHREILYKKWVDMMSMKETEKEAAKGQNVVRKAREESFSKVGLIDRLWCHS